MPMIPSILARSSRASVAFEMARSSAVLSCLGMWTTLRQFQAPRWSSIVSALEPAVISLVLVASALCAAHPCSMPSPHVWPEPGRNWKEKVSWHLMP